MGGLREGEKRGTECLEREPGNEAEILNKGSGGGDNSGQDLYVKLVICHCSTHIHSQVLCSRDHFSTEILTQSECCVP